MGDTPLDVARRLYEAVASDGVRAVAVVVLEKDGTPNTIVMDYAVTRDDAMQLRSAMHHAADRIDWEPEIRMVGGGQR